MVRGGKRDGAGRKPGINKIPYNTKMSRWVVEWLRAQKNQAQTIEEALVDKYKLKPPKTADPVSQCGYKCLECGEFVNVPIHYCKQKQPANTFGDL